MEHDQPHVSLADAGEFVELRDGRIWELLTETGEGVVVDLQAERREHAQPVEAGRWPVAETVRDPTCRG